MFETNEEVGQKLKETIHDYYMGYIKQKINYLFANGKENEISNQIMEFLDAQIVSEKAIISKDDIVKILNSVLIEDESNCSNANLIENRILHCLPDVATVNIENGEIAYLTEKSQTLFDGIKEISYYLYLSPRYYYDNIR